MSMRLKINLRCPGPCTIAARMALQLIGVASIAIPCTGFSQVPLPKHVPKPSPVRQLPAHMLPASVPDGFTVAAIGDLIMARPESHVHDPGFRSVERLIQGADIAFGNLEESLFDPSKVRVWPAPVNGGDTLNGPPSLALDIKEMGIDLLSHANNHTTDWGIRGMEATDRVLDRAGLVHAGTGKDLVAARAPRYLTTPQGHIALVAMTSSFTPVEPAGPSVRGVAGRPGVNMLRTRRYHIVTTQQMDWLSLVHKKFKALRGTSDLADTAHAQPANPVNKQLNLSGTHYRVGTTNRLTYTMNPYDLDSILRNIREGKEVSNFEIVYIHAHNPGNWSEKPADFLPKLAHDAIDAGADEFIASGPHRLRGIEIYKDKPIFYSLGNFFFEIGQLRTIAPNLVQRAHVNFDTTTDYEYHKLHLARSFNGPVWYQSIVAISRFNERGEVEEIRLYPIDLGYRSKPRARVGVPRMASPTVARHILKQLQKLSRPYGTHISIQGSIGIIRTPAKK